MLSITRIGQEDAHSELEEYLRGEEFLPLFFYSPYTLNTWLTHSGKALFFAELKGEKLIFVYKKSLNEIRFIFKEPSREMLDAIKNEYNPNYVGINEMGKPPQENIYFVQGEDIFLPLEHIVQLKDKDIRRKYKKCIRTHPQIKFERYSEEHEEKINEFITEWSTVRTDTQNKNAKTENDFRFLELYKNDQNILGGVVVDQEKIIAISFATPGLDENWVGPISKTLRGYTQLGVFTFVERAKLLYENGVTGLYVGAINNEFKKQFLKDAVINPVYAGELFKNPKKDFPDDYVWKLFG